jgi:hypothetical protein
MTSTPTDAIAAMAGFQQVAKRMRLLGNEGVLGALAAAVVVALQHDDFAAVVDGCRQMVRAAEEMPAGEYRGWERGTRTT